MEWYDYAKILMKEKGVVQEDLKIVFGVKTRGAIGHYLSGRRDPTIKQARDFSKFLGVDMDTLFGNKVEEEPSKKEEVTLITQILYELSDEAQHEILDVVRAIRRKEKSIKDLLSSHTP